MKMHVRHRFFIYQAIVIVIFILFQVTVFSLVEYHEWARTTPNDTNHMLSEIIDAILLNIILLPVMLLIAWKFSFRMLQPLNQIVTTAQRIQNGAFQDRIETSSMPDDDMRHLAETLNSAFNHYADAMDRLRRFSGDASHQLRTPIAAIRSTGEVAISRERDAASYRETIQDMLSELHRISQMVEQLLQLSKLESAQLHQQFKTFSANDAIRFAVELYQPLFEEAHIKLEAKLENSEFRIAGIEALFGELMHNLLDNALQHTPPGGMVCVGLEAGTNQNVSFYVQDSGKGIPEEYAKTIFERFVQIPNSKKGNAGLGLALASDIVALHGGHLKLATPNGQGARFEWTIPAAK
jgi:signal transduction histidine kinase